MVRVFVGLAIYCEIPIILFDTSIRKSELGNISKARVGSAGVAKNVIQERIKTVYPLLMRNENRF